jgi:hypothetical protein
VTEASLVARGTTTLLSVVVAADAAARTKRSNAPLAEQLEVADDASGLERPRAAAGR